MQQQARSLAPILDHSMELLGSESRAFAKQGLAEPGAYVHRPERLTVLLIAEGQAEPGVGPRAIPLKNGHGLLLGAGTRFRLNVKLASSIMIVEFVGEQADLGPIHWPLPLGDHSRFLARLGSAVSGGSDTPMSLPELDELRDRCRSERAFTMEGVGRLTSKRLSAKLEIARRLTLLRLSIDADPRADWTLAHMSSVACLSPFHLHRCFRHFFLQTPGQYVRLARLQLAKQLLASSQAPVLRVAEEVGFENFSAFVRCFRQNVGVTPQRFRLRTAA